MATWREALSEPAEQGQQLACEICGCCRFEILRYSCTNTIARCIACHSRDSIGALRPEILPAPVHEDVHAPISAEETVNETRDRITEFMRDRIRE